MLLIEARRERADIERIVALICQDITFRCRASHAEIMPESTIGIEVTVRSMPDVCEDVQLHSGPELGLFRNLAYFVLVKI